jgi:hypothetical protein
MVSYGEAEIETDDLWLAHDNQSVTGSVTINLPCVDCGQYLKSYTEDVEMPIEHTCPKAGEHECEECGGSGHIECDDCDGAGDIGETCEECGGRGTLMVSCVACNGSGKDEWGGTCEDCAGDMRVQGECAACDGTGDYTYDCTNCDGTGAQECWECGGTGTVDGGDVEYSWIGAEVAATDRYQTTDKRGKPIKNTRYMKHFYGAHISVEVSCDLCDEDIKLECDVEAQASAFDEVG